jgi:hypothetical protein
MMGVVFDLDVGWLGAGLLFITRCVAPQLSVFGLILMQLGGAVFGFCLARVRYCRVGKDR